MIGQIFLNSNKPYIITKLTPKTIFYKLLTKKIDVSYNNDVLLYCIGEYDVYTSYLEEPANIDKTEKTLKHKLATNVDFPDPVNPVTRIKLSFSSFNLYNNALHNASFVIQ